MRQLNAPFPTAILEGKYTEEYLSAAGANAPEFRPEDRLHSRRREPGGVRASAASVVLSPHGIPLAVYWAPNLVLGAPPLEGDLGRE